MFIGHFAVGFASKRVAPRTSLGLLLAAPLLPDLLWPVFLLLGAERVVIDNNLVTSGGNPFLTLVFTSYPWSHSLLMDIVWAALFGGIYYALTDYARGAWVLAVGVLSHWFLDVVTHLPDMPFSPWTGSVIGFGLWRSVLLTVIVEAVMFGAGVWLYSAGTAPRNGRGRFAWWGLVLFTSVGYLLSLRGSPPPTVSAIAWTGLILGALVVIWAWWADRHRLAAEPG